MKEVDRTNPLPTFAKSNNRGKALLRHELRSVLSCFPQNIYRRL